MLINLSISRFPSRSSLILRRFVSDRASGKRRFESGSWHEEEVPNWDQMSLQSVTFLTENRIVLPFQWRLCLLSFLLPVCVLSWTGIPFLESILSLSRISGLGYRSCHRSSSNGCVRLRWLFERFKYRGCLELWIGGRKPGARFCTAVSIAVV